MHQNGYATLPVQGTQLCIFVAGFTIELLNDLRDFFTSNHDLSWSRSFELNEPYFNIL